MAHYNLTQTPTWQTTSFCPYEKNSEDYQKIIKLCNIFQLECTCTYDFLCYVCQRIVYTPEVLPMVTYEDWKLDKIFNFLPYYLTLNLQH